MDRFDAGILGVAIIWASVMLAVVLENTPYFAQLLPILGGGAGGSIIVLGGSKPRKS